MFGKSKFYRAFQFLRHQSYEQKSAEQAKEIVERHLSGNPLFESMPQEELDKLIALIKMITAININNTALLVSEYHDWLSEQLK